MYEVIRYILLIVILFGMSLMVIPMIGIIFGVLKNLI